MHDNDSLGTLTEGYYGSVLPLAVVMAIPNAAWCSVLFETCKVFEDVSLRHDACIDSYLPATNSFLLYRFSSETRQHFDTEVATFALCTLNEAEVYTQEPIAPALPWRK